MPDAQPPIGNKLTSFDGCVLTYAPPMREAVHIPIDAIQAVLWRQPGRLHATHLKVMVAGAVAPVEVSPPFYRGLGKKNAEAIEVYSRLAEALTAAIASRGSAPA